MEIHEDWLVRSEHDFRKAVVCRRYDVSSWGLRAHCHFPFSTLVPAKDFVISRVDFLHANPFDVAMLLWPVRVRRNGLLSIPHIRYAARLAAIGIPIVGLS